MVDIILFGILGLFIFIGAILLVTSAEWCQKLMLKKYFPQTVEILKHYQAVYKMWQMVINDVDKIDDKIKWHTERLEYCLVVNDQEIIQELNQLYLKRKQLREVEKNLKELLKQDKFLIEAHAPFILFSDFHPFKIYDRQTFCLFDVMGVHRKQKKIKKILDKQLSYLKKSGK